jgi:membrane protein implicated in regulation of membrane protease activity
MCASSSACDDPGTTKAHGRPEGADTMNWFLGFGIAGIALLVLSLVLDGVLEGLVDGIGAADGLFDGLLSLPVIAGFVSMLGFTGAIVLGTTELGAATATVVGAGAGTGAGWLTWKLSRALMRDQTAATPRGSDLIGSAGTVVTAIPSDGYGEVLLQLGGQPVKFASRSPVAVARGAEVWVEEVLSPTSVAVRSVER